MNANDFTFIHWNHLNEHAQLLTKNKAMLGEAHLHVFVYNRPATQKNVPKWEHSGRSWLSNAQL